VRTIILMYHGVTPVGGGTENMHRISEGCFREQMTYLNQSGYAVLPWKEMMRAGRLEDDRTAVGLTFDDANLSDVACARFLRLVGYSALFFVPTGYLDQDERLSRSDVAELSDRGMGIGSHSHRHAQLARLNDSELEEELARSKAILEEIIKLPVEHLSFPGGSYDGRVLSVARKIGYRYFYTSEWGSNGTSEAARGVLRRIPLVDGMSIEGFRDILEMRDYQKKRVQFHLKELAKRALGERNYLKLRRALVKQRPTVGEGGDPR
jgi:peptidoglycan/xylan/chitin deacetylase (PgdA/CDA1 family)